MNYELINGYGIEDPGFELLRQVAQKYCPEELQSERKAVVPDDALNLSAIADLFKTFVGVDNNPAPTENGLSTPLPHREGQGGGSVAGGSALGVQPFGERELSSLHYEEVDTLNSEEIKKDFPVLHQKVNGHDLVWLDNGATTQKPIQVIDKISDYYKNYNSNIHRGAHTLAARATDAYEEAREKGATLKAIPTDKNGDLILSEFERLITPRTRFVSVGHVNNTFGTINDVKRIIDIAHSHNIPVLIDGAQSIAHTPVDVQQLGADFFVFSGHKIYGPNGIGVVYGRKDLLDKMQPWQGGGNMIKDVTIERTEYNVPPARFEAGTPNVADAIGLGAALDYVSHLGIRNIEAHEHKLTEYAREQLAQIKGLTLIGNPKNRVSVVSFVLDGIPVPETGTLLDKEGIAVRAGHHCAQPALRALGYEMSVRPTFALYNTREDVDKLVIAVRKIVGSRQK